jgi:hypothetical protein
MRTKGATSNVLVPLWKLNEIFGPSAMIPVARRFADQNNIIGKAMSATDDNIKAAGNAPAIEERIALTEHHATDTAGEETPLDADGSGQTE